MGFYLGGCEMTNEIQVLETNSIITAFNTENGIKSIIESIRDQVDDKINGVVWDFTKKKDRDLVASLAHKVARSKTAIDAEGKKLKEQYTVITDKIDAERKLAREALDAEKDRIRKPLTDWENAGKERKASHEGRIFGIKRLVELCEDQNSVFIQDQILALDVLIIDNFEEYEQEAKLAKFETLEKLRNILKTREIYEAEQAELEALRLAEQQRIQREHEERIAREATEKAQCEAEEKARLEAERVQREKLEAKQREARLQAEKESALLREEQLKQKAIDDAKQAELRAEAQAKQAEHNKQLAIRAERERIEFERLAKEEAERKAEQARLANVEHMRKINNDVLSVIVQTGITEEQAKAIIKMIAKNEVPHVKINY